jgi:hypothetical protein
LQQQPAAISATVKIQKPKAGFALSLIAGILVVIQGIVRLVQSRALEISGVTDKITGRILAGVGLAHLGALALLFGALILVGAILMYKTTMVLPAALIVLVFSILSIIAGGLFGLLGFIIGIIGAILALAKK